jgi:hypothetical protein
MTRADLDRTDAAGSRQEIKFPLFLPAIVHVDLFEQRRLSSAQSTARRLLVSTMDTMSAKAAHRAPS